MGEARVMYRDLRDFLAFLDQSGDIFHIWEELSPVQEIAGMIKLLNKKIGSVVFFHRVKGYNIPVVANLLGSEKLLSLAFNTSLFVGGSQTSA